MFAETMRTLVGPRGRAGIIVPTGIATDDTTKEFFASLVERRSLVSLFGFYDRKQLFTGSDVHSFCLLTVSGTGIRTDQAEFIFFAKDVVDLAERERRFQLTAEDFRLFNPNTKTCPIFRTRRDTEITRRIFERVPVLIDRTRGEEGNPWGISFMRMFDMTNDSALFRTRDELEAQGWTLVGNVFERGAERYLPLYEGKTFHQFDHRWASYEDGEWRELTTEEKKDPYRVALPRYWAPRDEVDERLHIGTGTPLPAWRDIARATDERTLLAALLPYVATGNKAPLALSEQDVLWALPTCLSSFVLDYAARSKVGGVTLNFFIVEQFPVLPPSAIRSCAAWHLHETVGGWLAPRVAELTCTAVDMEPLAHELGYDHAPFPWDDTRRQLVRAELDAAFFHLYGLPREDVDYIMDTFPVVRRRDEATHGEYRTKRLILERYDALAESIATGTPYQTLLNPPPADPRIAHRSHALTWEGLHEADTTATI